MIAQFYYIFQLNAGPFGFTLKGEVGHNEITARYQRVVEILLTGGIPSYTYFLFADSTGNAELTVVPFYVFGTGLCIAVKDIAGRFYVFSYKAFCFGIQFPVVG